MNEIEKKLLLAIWASKDGFEFSISQSNQPELIDSKQLFSKSLGCSNEEIGSALYKLEKRSLVADEQVEDLFERYVEVDIATLESKMDEGIYEDEFIDIRPSTNYHLTHEGFTEVTLHISEFYQLAKTEDLQSFFAIAGLKNPFSRHGGEFNHRHAEEYLSQLATLKKIDELELKEPSAPASDRVVALNHNSPEYLETNETISALVEALRCENKFSAAEPNKKDQILAELKATQELLKASQASPTTITKLVYSALGFLAAEFAGAPIGELAEAAWAALKLLLGN